MLKLGQENDFDAFFQEVKNNDPTKYIFEFMNGFVSDDFEDIKAEDYDDEDEDEDFELLVNKFLSKLFGDNFAKYQSDSDANFYDGCDYVWIRTIKPMTCKEFYDFMTSDGFWHENEEIFSDSSDAGNTKVIKIVE